jgi:DeoR/GlpR family transcriptional regulator of sugar metabolism
LGEAVEQKKRVARAAAALLEADETVFIDSSTTAYYAARRILAGTSGFTCLTNLVPVMDLFTTADPSGASMVGLGGIFRALTLSFVGPCTIQTIESYIADRALISVKGITSRGYLTDINPLEAEVKRAMIRQSERPVLLVDGRKFEQRGSSVIAHVSEVSLVVTADARRPHVEAIEDLGVDVQSL